MSGKRSGGRAHAKKQKAKLREAKRSEVDTVAREARASESDLINPRLDWHIVRTAPQRERTTARRLISSFGPGLSEQEKAGRLACLEHPVGHLQIYLPCDRYILRARGRMHPRLLSNYPGYLFVGIVRGERLHYHIGDVEGVQAPLGGWVTPRLIQGRDLIDIEKWFTAPSRHTILPKFVLKKGRFVTVIDGPWMGLPGMVKDLKSNGVIDVLVRIFGRETVVEMTADELAEDPEKKFRQGDGYAYDDDES